MFTFETTVLGNTRPKTQWKLKTLKLRKAKKNTTKQHSKRPMFRLHPDFATCHNSPRERMKTTAIQPKIPSTKLCAPRDFNLTKDFT